MQVTLIRHGETDWNVSKIIQGHSDIPLNARGEHQAKYASKYFLDTHFEAIYSSDLSRASKTAELLTNQSPITDPGLREKWMGIAEGRPVAEVYGLDRTKDPIMDYGETEKELIVRMVATYNRILANHTEGPILIVAHGACLRALIKGLVKNGQVDAHEWTDLVLRGHKPFANCSRTVIADNKLTEYATELVDAEYADPQVV